MMKSKLRYYCNMLAVGLVFVILETYTETHGALLGATQGVASAIYISQLAVAAFALLAMWLNFNSLREKPAQARLVLTASAILVIVQYFFRYDTNLLWLLPMIAVVYIFRYEALTRS